MKAEIITIGTEILIGQIVDTNSAWMGEELNAIGVEVWKITTIKDDAEEIKSTLKRALNEVDIVLFTGGLGPTNDDITKVTLAKYFDSQLIQNKECLDNVYDIFNRFNRPVSQVNIDQALVPDKCVPIVNKAGTAPGMWFDHEGKVIVSMPGVPFEMKWLMRNEILPRLEKKFRLPVIKHKTILTSGEGESAIAERLQDFELSLPNGVSLAYLPSPGRVRLRMTVVAENDEKAVSLLDEYSGKLNSFVKDLKYGEDQDSLESVVLDVLRGKELTLSCAESCTGGSIASSLVSIAGSSDVFKGSVVSYWEEVKQGVIAVDEELIKEHGVVSEEVAVAMAEGVKKLIKSDCSISTTGVAGPDGGTEENPVGKVCIACCFNDQTIVNTYFFAGSRNKIIERARMTALNQLRKLVLES